MSQPKIITLTTNGEKAFKTGRYEAAAQCYREAAAWYQEIGDTAKAAEMANNLSVALLQSGDFQAALEAAQGTDLVFAQAGDQRSQALALGNQAAALEALNRLGEALEMYQKCSDLLKQAGDAEYRAYVLKSISALQMRTGHHFEGLASMDAALSNKKQLNLQERFFL